MTPVGRVPLQSTGYPPAILIVEDNPMDRQLLRYLLEPRFRKRFQRDPIIYEANNLQAAFYHLEQGQIDCIILDLELPDSMGKETFLAIVKQFPTIPIVVMTNNKNEDLALDMIQSGAADYLLKDYTDEEAIFRHVLFAIERHRRTVPVSLEDALKYRRLEQVEHNLLRAQGNEESPSTVRNMTVETTSAVASLSRRMFSELQRISVNLAKQQANQEAVARTVQTLDKELLRGHSNRPSVRSQLDLLDHRVSSVEGQVTTISDAEDTQRREALQITQTKMSVRAKILVGVLAFIGTLSAAVATYLAATTKLPTGQLPIPKPSATTTTTKK